jgi:hypothetical protein
MLDRGYANFPEHLSENTPSSSSSVNKDKKRKGRGVR